MSAVDSFWGIPPSDAVAPAAATPLARWQRVHVDGGPLGLDGGVGILLPQLRPVQGDPLISVEYGSQKLALAARSGDGTVELAFDPDETVEALTSRAAMTERPPLSARLPFQYHRVPAPVRAVVRNVLVGRSSSEAFPAWPVEASVEAVRRIYLRARQAADPGLEPAPFWPDGKRFALCLTQDVDTAEGVPVAVEMAGEQRERGLGCCWFVVGEAYQLADTDAAALRERGEIGLHDMRHDNKIAFMQPAEIAQRLDGARPLIERLGIHGFRSPSMLRTPVLYDALEGRFEWDSSVPDTGLYPTSNGCATVFPYTRGELVVLPATIPPDGQLLGRGLSPDQVLDAWKAKVDWVARVGGVAVHLAHPERGFSADPPMREVYRRFLDWVAARGDAWLALPSQVADHWRRRSS